MPGFGKHDLVGHWKDLSQARKKAAGDVMQKLLEEQESVPKKRPFLLKLQKLGSAESVEKKERRKSAWDHYLERQRSSMKLDHPEYSIGKVSQEASKLWKIMNDKQKAHFDKTPKSKTTEKTPKKGPAVADMDIVAAQAEAVQGMYPGNLGMPKGLTTVVEKNIIAN